MATILPLAEIKPYIGREIGASAWMLIDQDRVDTFADCTEDRLWIHVDSEKAARGPYGRTVAHGFLTLSLLPYLSRDMTLIPEEATLAINYGMNKVRFIHPVPVGARIRDVMTLKDIYEKQEGKILMTMGHVIEIQGERRPACVLETLRLFVPHPSV